MREAEAIAACLEIVPIADAIRGPGDDATVLAPPPGNLVWATDLVLEGRHFDRRWSSLADAAYKAVARNASDLAAMGAEPVAFLAAVALPDTDPATVQAIAEGFRDAAKDFDLPVAGGDLSRNDQVHISVSVLGRVDGAGLGRDGARPGDVVAVTGSLGAAAAAWELRSTGGREDLLERFPALLARTRRGVARLEAGRVLRDVARAAIDLSDGLAADARRIALASGVAIRLDLAALPLEEGVRETADVLGRDPARLALVGGDDYELLVTLPPERFEEMRAQLAPLPFTRIGEVVAGAGELLEADGAPIPEEGHDHFA